MAIAIALIMELRRRTGVGLSDCQRALEHSHGDLNAAVAYLRQQGALKTAKKIAERTAGEGVVAAYVHAGGRVGTLVEINCETDFVARNEDFRQFAHDIAMQVAAANPQYVSADAVPPEVIAQEQAMYRAQIAQSGKPAAVAEKIIAGKLQQFYRENCLLQQPFIKDDSRTVQQVLEEQVAKLGEKVVIRKFSRFEIG